MIAALYLSLALVPAWLSAQDSAGFVALIGADTIAIERFSRTEGRLEGELSDRATGRRVVYWLEHDEEMLSIRFGVNLWPSTAAQDATPSVRTTLEFLGDSVIAEVIGAPTPPHQRMPSEVGAVPFLNLSFALVEQVLMRAAASEPPAARVPLFLVSNGSTLPARLAFISPDSLTLTVAGVEMRMAVGPDGRLLGGTVPAQNLRIRRIGAPADAGLRERSPDYGPPEGAPYTGHEVRIKVPAGHTLVGTLTVPESVTPGGPVPAAVLISGSGSQDRDESLRLVPGYRPFRQMADTLSRRGIAVLRLDDRGVGASGGDPRLATSEDLADDVRAAVAWLRARPDIDPARIALIGHSEGSLIASMVVAEDPAVEPGADLAVEPAVAAVVLLAGPSRTGRSVIEYQNRQVIGADTLSAEGLEDALREIGMRLDSLAASQPWLAYFLEYDPLPAVRRVRVPVLILHGATDRQVTADQAGELAEALREAEHEDVTLHVYPNLNHLFLPDSVGRPNGYPALPVKRIPADVLGDLADWLSARLSR